MRDPEFIELRDLLCAVLGLEDCHDRLFEDTPLLGAFPEFDSLAVLTLISELQKHYAISIHDEEVDPEIFENVASLRRFIDSKRST